MKFIQNDSNNNWKQGTKYEVQRTQNEHISSL